jgi:hypothetical protein
VAVKGWSLGFTMASGWGLVTVLALTAWLPFALRRVARAPGVGDPLRPHYAVGGLIVVLAWAHGWVSMAGGVARRGDGTGLQLATMALLLILVETGLGLFLRARGGGSRATLRTGHRAVAWVLGALVLGHVALDTRLLEPGSPAAGAGGASVA